MKNFQNATELLDWLKAVHIDISLWGGGSAKSIDNLWDELISGESTLRDNPPRRVVNVVQILIHKDDRILVEAEQELADGWRRARNLPPSEKMKSGENYADTAVRCLQEEIGVNPEAVTLLTESYRQTQEEFDSPSYPGLRTQYAFHIIEAQVNGLPDEDFWRDNQAHGDGDPVRRHLWGWR